MLIRRGLTVATLTVLVASAGADRTAAAAPGRVLTVTTTIRKCTDCSLPERSRPSRLRFPSPGVGVVTVKGMNWKSWGSGSTSAKASAAIETNGVDRGRAQVKLYRLRSHIPDGCGHTASERIYTRVRIRLHGFALERQNRTVTIRLPRTGCETA
jgi:hypothetical protein